MDGTELPGFRKKSFALAFRGGEIWFEHLDGMYEHTNLAREKLARDYIEFKRPSSPALLAFNLDETNVDNNLINDISAILIHGEKRLLRVVFVGVKFAQRQKFKKALRCADFALHFENDFEKAKEWLIC